MDSDHIEHIMNTDTSYANDEHPVNMVYTSLQDGRAKTFRPSDIRSHHDGIFQQAVLGSPMTVIYICQTRLYLKWNTFNAIALTKTTWRSLLARFDILPSFIELLHNNNGGSLIHATPWSSTDQTSVSEYNSVETFHLGYKMGNWANEESAIYARVDFRTGRSVVLIMGTERCWGLDRVSNLLSTCPQASILHVVQAFHAATYHLAEKVRWEVDYRTQDLEALTGIGILPNYAGHPLRPEELCFNRTLQVAADFTRSVVVGTARVGLNLQAFAEHLSQFEAIDQASANPVMTADALRSVRQSCAMYVGFAKHQHEQTQQLHARLQSQLSITKKLMAQRDTQINLEIVGSAQRDSKLMRGIATITMIFLPATFVATFFSMVFFHVGDEQSIHLTIDPWIWVYPAVTLPLSIGFAFWYSAWSHGWSWRTLYRMSRRPVGAKDCSRKILTMEDLTQDCKGVSTHQEKQIC